VESIVQASRLRPLSIGEMLDRAVSLSVKFFVPLALMWLAFQVPLAVFQYYGTADFSKAFLHIIDAIQRSGSNPDPQTLARDLQVVPVFNAFTVTYILAALFVSPLAHAALIAALSSAYVQGTIPSFGDAYRVALRAWLGLFGAALVWLAFALLAYLVLVIAGVIIALLLFGMTALSRGLGITVGVIAVLAGLASLVACVSVAVMAVGITFYAIVVEGAGFITAFSSALSRTVGRTLTRSLLAGLAYCAVICGFSIVELIAGVLMTSGLRLGHFALAAASIVPALVTTVFTTSFMGVYYFDVRIRTEGFDIDLAARESAAGALPPG
jgi:hypothetical protein